MNVKKFANDIDAAVGANLRRIRAQKGRSQEALAEKIGVTFQQVQKYEKGTNRISASKIVAICEALDCDLNSLFVGVEPGGANVALPAISARALRMAALFDRLPSDNLRNAIQRLAASLAGEAD